MASPAALWGSLTLRTRPAQEPPNHAGVSTLLHVRISKGALKTIWMLEHLNCCSYTNIQSSISHNNQKVEIINVPHEWVNKMWYIHPYSGILFSLKKEWNSGNSLVVQWLRLHAFIAEGVGSIPGWGTKIPEATWCGQKKGNEILTHAYNMDEPWGHYAEWNKPDTKEQILYDSTYKRYLE